MSRRQFVAKWAWWASRRITAKRVERLYASKLITRAERGVMLAQDVARPVTLLDATRV